MAVKRFDVYLVNLNPKIGNKIQKTRPCLVISPDEMNHYISTVMVAPLTPGGRTYPSRVICQFQSKEGQVVLDQICTVDKVQLVKCLGRLSAVTQKKVLAVLVEMFAE
ncbi:MAG: type II toxin-antitoxin system PemK/MazF family toxin [Leptolyngbyaceae cyanobacterium CRU_2_3]|nr:type II toxin-antitoxin system PemK/MazF family toxin [Leptolyngbyaceae cyanobacterium CRU_2_3]